MPRCSFSGEIFVIETIDEDSKISNIFDNESIIGFDTECRPSLSGGKTPTALIQLSSKSKAVLWRINKIGGLPPSLIKYLTSSKLVKVAHGGSLEIAQIQSEFDIIMKSVIDLHTVAIALRTNPRSLQGLTALFLGRYLDKSEQLTDWEIPTALNEKQIQYAATDAWVSLEVLEAARAFYNVNALPCEKVLNKDDENRIFVNSENIEVDKNLDSVGDLSSRRGIRTLSMILEFQKKAKASSMNIPGVENITYSRGKVADVSDEVKKNQKQMAASRMRQSFSSQVDVKLQLQLNEIIYSSSSSARSMIFRILNVPKPVTNQYDPDEELSSVQQENSNNYDDILKFESAMKSLLKLSKQFGVAARLAGTASSSGGGLRVILEIRGLGKNVTHVESKFEHATLGDAQNDAAIQALSHILSSDKKIG